MRARWPGGLDVRAAEHPPRLEAAIPSVDSTRARTRLGWRAAVGPRGRDRRDRRVAPRRPRRPDLSLEQIERHGAMTAAPA